MKLVLFDIDGTLTYHVGTRRWEEQYAYGIKMAYGLDVVEDFGKYNGNVEWQMAWEILRSHGVSKKEFEQKYEQYLHAMYEHLQAWSKKGDVFQPIADAKRLVLYLQTKHPEITLGVLTGNAKRIAQWKLAHTGFVDMFTVGLYGDDATNRIELAKRVFETVNSQLHKDIQPRDIIVIGDTIHDIRCGKAIGATTIAVTTGMHGDRDMLVAERPDHIVDSLMDASILSLFDTHE